MLTPPDSVTDQDVLKAVAEHWLPEADEAAHLPWGFGAHHWRVSGGGTVLFATLDALAPRHSARSWRRRRRGRRHWRRAGWSRCARRSGRVRVPGRGSRCPTGTGR
ncbi:hypothetical protein [Streptomyces sp. B5E4]|uniref:hypothetical protein n=1 Tax=Streptomyces sp. B5E4 TaxID=3153568 RepID=UPI00325E2B7C